MNRKETRGGYNDKISFVEAMGKKQLTFREGFSLAINIYGPLLFGLLINNYIAANAATPGFMENIFITTSLTSGVITTKKIARERGWGSRVSEELE